MLGVHLEEHHKEGGMLLCKSKERERNSPADPWSVGKEGQEILPQPMEKVMEKQDVTWQPMELHGGAEIHLHPVGNPTLEQWGAQRRL